jgi:hypothetical protein
MNEIAMYRADGRMESNIVIATTKDGSEYHARLVQYDGESEPRWASCDQDGSNEFLLIGVVLWRAIPVMEHSDHRM